MLIRALGVFLALEALYWLLRRLLPSFSPRLTYRLWALVFAGVFAGPLFPVLEAGAVAWKIAVTATALLSALVAFSLAEAVLLSLSRRQGKTAPMPKLAREVLRVVVLIAIGLVLAHVVFGQPLNGLVVSSATLVAIVGFALQDVLKNVFAGMTLQMERAFQRGDWLLYGDLPARVIDMNFRSTHLRTNDGHVFVVPNSLLAGERIVNLGNGDLAVALPFRVALPYSVPPLDAKRALLEAARSAPGVVETPSAEAFLDSFGESGVNYRLRVWTRQQEGLSGFTDAVNTRVWYQLQRAKIQIPYPIRTVQLYNQDRGDRRQSDQEKMRAEALLANLPLFEELPAIQLRALAGFAHHEHYDAGEVLVREGERRDSLFLIERGQVKVVKGAEDGDSLELAILGGGDFFGERSLLTGEPRGATVISLTGCECFILDRESIAPFLVADPTLASVLSRALAARQAATNAKLEGYHAADRRSDRDTERSFLARIRQFFALPEG
jgi:small-conductance mechanosensitive channel/CRP-like cAMP-binding protein